MSSGNQHLYLLKSRYGKVSNLRLWKLFDVRRVAERLTERSGGQIDFDIVSITDANPVTNGLMVSMECSIDMIRAVCHVIHATRTTLRRSNPPSLFVPPVSVCPVRVQ
jgi:hypothetical protein